MFNKLLMAFAMFFLMLGSVSAAVDLNTADQAALDSVKGIGAVKSKAILEERKKAGQFKDWADFEKRVKGFAGKSTDKLSKAGVTINGQPKTAAAAAASKGSTAAAAANKGSTPAPTGESATPVKK